MAPLKRVSVVVPSYNEPALDADVARIARFLPPDSEIIVVDDSEATPQVSGARVLRGRKLGKGDAVRLGMVAAEGEVIFHLDADIDDEKLALIPDFIRLIDEGHDVAIAERRGRWQYRNLGRFILSIGLFAAQRFFIFHSTRFFDTQCGFKAFRREAARTLAELQTVSGGMYDIEYLYIAVKQGMRIAQVPVTPIRELRPSRLRVLRCLRTDPVDLLRVKWNGLRGRYSDQRAAGSGQRAAQNAVSPARRPPPAARWFQTSITNRIRSVIDALPRSIRDARWFMWPFFFVWFKGKHVRTAMEFKSLAPSMSDAELADAYRKVTTFADNRVTDTNAEAMAYVLTRLGEGTLLDVGSGRGYFLSRVARLPGCPVVRWVGCDLLGGDVMAVAERLPFRDQSFDVVTCFHTLEHTRDLPRAISELRRVARRQLVVIVPRQRRFHYTLDLHLQFFETPEALAAVMGGPGEIRQFGSDLVYISAP